MRALVLVLLCAPTLAQTGTLDQVSQFNTALNANSSFLEWQQQVRVGLSGQLEGFEMQFKGPIGAQGTLALRLGDGWNTSAPVWTTWFTKSITSEEAVFFDVTGASIELVSGDTLVVELLGNDTGLEVRGSYTSAAVGPPLYPEPLYLNGPLCFDDCGWRLAFRTWMLGASPNYCMSTANSTGAAAVMSFGGSKSVSANDLVLTASPVPDQPGLFIQGLAQADQPLGPGTLCVAVPFHRLQFAFGVGQSMSYAVDQPSLPVDYQAAAGSTWHYQCWYRDPGVGPGYNLSDGLTLTFTP